MVRIPFSSTVLQRRRGYRRRAPAFLQDSAGPDDPTRQRGHAGPARTQEHRALVRGSGPSSASFTNFRCWRAHPFDRGGRPSVPSRPISQPAGPSNGLQVCAWCTASTSPGRDRDEDILLGAAAPRYRAFYPRRAKPRPPPFRREVPCSWARRCGTCRSDKDGSFASSVSRGAAFRLATRRSLHPRGCPKSCRVSARFRLRRLSGTRWIVIREAQPRAMVCCERHCGGMLGGV